MTEISSQVRLDYEPQPRQVALHRAAARQIFYGGAAGGGKSHALRWEAIALCLANPGLQYYLFRRTLPELEDNHIIHFRRLPSAIGNYHETRKEYNFTNGSTIHLAFAEREQDIFRYRGAEMHVVGVDEASLMTEFQLGLIRAWNRLGGYRPSPDYAHALPRCVFASNPGGPAHSFLKRTFIDPAPPETVFYDPSMADPDNPEDRGWSTTYIPARMADNKYLDSNYTASFGGLPPEMAKAYREGNWDVVVGAALHNLSRERHMIRPFDPPRFWTHFMSIDWGTARPFAVGWFCVSPENVELKGKGVWSDVFLPEGAVVMYREFYGWTGKTNEGLRWSSDRVAQEILRMEKEHEDPPMDYRVADSQMWAQTDGPSPAERMTHIGLSLRQAKKDRKAAYAEMLARLAGNPTFLKDGVEEIPMLYVTQNCTQFWRTVPPLVIDSADPEKGPDTKLEDHVYDCLVYALRSRPFVTVERDRWEHERRLAGIERGIQDPYSTGW